MRNLHHAWDCIVALYCVDFVMISRCANCISAWDQVVRKVSCGLQQKNTYFNTKAGQDCPRRYFRQGRTLSGKIAKKTFWTTRIRIVRSISSFRIPHLASKRNLTLKKASQWKRQKSILRRRKVVQGKIRPIYQTFVEEQLLKIYFIRLLTPQASPLKPATTAGGQISAIVELIPMRTTTSKMIKHLTLATPEVPGVESYGPQKSQNTILPLVVSYLAPGLGG